MITREAQALRNRKVIISNNEPIPRRQAVVRKRIHLEKMIDDAITRPLPGR
jgi:hypothetical protein